MHAIEHGFPFRLPLHVFEAILLKIVGIWYQTVVGCPVVISPLTLLSVHARPFTWIINCPWTAGTPGQ